MKFVIEIGRGSLASNSGLVLAGKILARLNLDAQVNGIAIPGCVSEPKITNADVIRAYVGLLVLGRTAYEDIEIYREHGFFRRALGIRRVASSETLRQRLDVLAGRVDEALKAVNEGILKKATLTPVRTERGAYLPLDVDVSPMDNSKTKKEGVGRTYKGMDGYAPIFAYVGAEGHMANCALRPGTQHCQKGTPEFLRETLDVVERLKSGQEILTRMDAGNDAAENVRLCRGRSRYIIKRNLRRENVEDWLGVAQIYGVKSEPRLGKTVYVGACTRFMDNGQEDLEPWRVVFEVTVRTILAKGERLLLPDIEVDTYWTDLEEYPETVIELYHAHGTSEQFHSELKSDMDVERLPSGKFATNATVLRAAMVAFNVLRRIGQGVLAVAGDVAERLSVQRLRLRTVLQDIMCVACQYVRSGHRHVVKLAKDSRWVGAIQILHARL